MFKTYEGPPDTLAWVDSGTVAAACKGTPVITLRKSLGSVSERSDKEEVIDRDASRRAQRLAEAGFERGPGKGKEGGLR